MSDVTSFHIPASHLWTERIEANSRGKQETFCWETGNRHFELKEKVGKFVGVLADMWGKMGGTVDFFRDILGMMVGE